MKLATIVDEYDNKEVVYISDEEFQELMLRIFKELEVEMELLK